MTDPQDFAEPSFDDLMEQVGQVERVRALERQILKARQDYYNKQPTVSDDVYDAWVDELAALSKNSPAVTAIGAPPSAVSEWKKVQHHVPMGSLFKINTPEELTEWLRARTSTQFDPILVTEKLDGISIHVRYENGILKQAITRGDGTVGEDITVNVARMKGVPAKLPKKQTISVRGEILVTKTDFEKHFAGTYANTRNTASGIAKRYDGRGCETLSVLFYRVIEGQDFATEVAQFEWLRAAGFKTPNWYLVSNNIVGMKNPHDVWLEYQETKRDQLDYDIDGLVLWVNDMARQMALGEKDGRPEGGVAYKFASVKRETVITAIKNETGGQGVITPVAEFNPVQLLGATVSRASLYNWKYIRELGADVGASVLVARANDVIPRVVSVVKGVGSVAQPPKACPSCGASTVFEGEFLTCPNTSDCPAQTVGRIKRWIVGLDVKDFGDVLIEKLVCLGLVKTVGDLYRLRPEQIASIERMGERSAQTALDNLWEKNPTPLELLLGCLSIPLCATATIKLAMDHGIDTWEKMNNAEASQFEKIPGLGPVKAQALVKWLRGRGSALVPDLLSAGVKIQEKIQGVLSGMSFCFTGASKRTRPELMGIVKAAGGDVKNSVTKKLTYLVMADPNSTTTKAQAARKNGTRCISEEDFLKLAGVSE